MPVLVDRGPGGCSIVAGKDTAAQRLQARRHPAGSDWIEIGLVNNMPDAALEATERQFLELARRGRGRQLGAPAVLLAAGRAAQRARPQLSQPILSRYRRISAEPSSTA